MIRIEKLTKKYDDLAAVRDLTLDIPKGQFFAFLGPNGAGKTTTIKVLTGLLKPTQGRTLIGGFDVQKEPMKAKQLIGYIPDHPYLYEKLSGRDFFHFVGDLFEIPRDEQQRQMDHYFKLFSLTQAADKLIENYSHGMRQKLVISVSFMHRPLAIVVDEPMVGLDPQSAKIVKNLFKEKTREGATVFLSTHTLSVAEELADQIGIINKGRLLFLGTLEELRDTMRTKGNLEVLLEMTGSAEAEQGELAG